MIITHEPETIYNGTLRNSMHKTVQYQWMYTPSQMQIFLFFEPQSYANFSAEKKKSETYTS